MRAVVQRVSRAKVTVGSEITGEIESGSLILLGVAAKDTEADADYLVEKVLNLRIFEDGDGKMNLSLLDVKGGLLVVSQFTLYGDTRRGRRPSFIDAAPPEQANRLYEYFVAKARAQLGDVDRLLVLGSDYRRQLEFLTFDRQLGDLAHAISFIGGKKTAGGSSDERGSVGRRFSSVAGSRRFIKPPDLRRIARKIASFPSTYRAAGKCFRPRSEHGLRRGRGH